MKKIALFFCLFSLFGCVEENEPYSYYKFIRFKNTSDKVLDITFEDTTINHIYFTERLNPNQSTDYYQHYSLERDYFNGFGTLGDKITVKFTNGNLGYICGDYPDSSGLCFTTKGSPLRNPNESDFILDKQERDNVKYYTYEITQEDYENAHVLP